jgi:hypothetical protein
MATWGAHSKGGVDRNRDAPGNGEACTRGTHGQGARKRAPLMMDRGRTPRSWRGAHAYAPIIGGRNKGVHCSKEEGIYGLSSSFEVAKPSLPGSLPSTCKVLCLGLWRLGDLALHT